MKTVQLDDAGIDFDRDMLDAGAHRARHQPRRYGRTDDDPEVWSAIDQCVDDFDRPGSMTKAMAGDIENDRSSVVQRGFYGGSTGVLRTFYGR